MVTLTDNNQKSVNVIAVYWKYTSSQQPPFQLILVGDDGKEIPLQSLSPESRSEVLDQYAADAPM